MIERGEITNFRILSLLDILSEVNALARARTRVRKLIFIKFAVRIPLSLKRLGKFLEIPWEFLATVHGLKL